MAACLTCGEKLYLCKCRPDLHMLGMMDGLKLALSIAEMHVSYDLESYISILKKTIEDLEKEQ